jgi:hypothetical protein
MDFLFYFFFILNIPILCLRSKAGYSFYSL